MVDFASQCVDLPAQNLDLAARLRNRRKPRLHVPVIALALPATIDVIPEAHDQPSAAKRVGKVIQAQCVDPARIPITASTTRDGNTRFPVNGGFISVPSRLPWDRVSLLPTS